MNKKQMSFVNPYVNFNGNGFDNRMLNTTINWNKNPYNQPVQQIPGAQDVIDNYFGIQSSAGVYAEQGSICGGEIHPRMTGCTTKECINENAPVIAEFIQGCCSDFANNNYSGDSFCNYYNQQFGIPQTNNNYF